MRTSSVVLPVIKCCSLPKPTSRRLPTNNWGPYRGALFRILRRLSQAVFPRAFGMPQTFSVEGPQLHGWRDSRHWNGQRHLIADFTEVVRKRGFITGLTYGKVVGILGSHINTTTKAMQSGGFVGSTDIEMMPDAGLNPLGRFSTRAIPARSSSTPTMRLLHCSARPRIAADMAARVDFSTLAIALDINPLMLRGYRRQPE